MVSVMVFSVLVLAFTELILTDSPKSETEEVCCEMVHKDELVLLQRAGTSAVDHKILFDRLILHSRHALRHES
jgi:hypothetical protein